MSMNDLIRRAARGNGETPRAQVGSIGVGRGGACAPRPPAMSGQQFNETVRSAARLARTATIRGGIRLDDVTDLDALLGGR
jgi:hypothetical protein